jgi:hypothetical protein
MTIENQAGAGVRADLNLCIGALVSNSSGSTEPTTTFAYQFWVDTSGSSPLLKIRDGANLAWISLGQIDIANFGYVPLTGNVNVTSQITFTNNDYIAIPVGSTAQRPGSPANGMIRYNTSLSTFEGYQSSAWFSFGNPMTAGGDIIYGGSGGAATRLANGSSGQVLTSTGGTSPPAWGTVPTILSVVAKTTAYSILTTDDVILCSSAIFSVTLPTAVGNTGKVFRIKKTDSSTTNIITVATTSSQTIDGSTTRALGIQYEAVAVVSDGANWSVIA